jgi:hypothetical protein
LLATLEKIMAVVMMMVKVALKRRKKKRRRRRRRIRKRKMMLMWYRCLQSLQCHRAPTPLSPPLLPRLAAARYS